jgi:Flp pilus assembly protein TadG
VKIKGQALVEMALILPIIILVLVAIIDFGLLFNNYLLVTNSSREGAREAALGQSDEDIQSDILHLLSTLKESEISINIYPSKSSRSQGSQVVITVGYQYKFLTPIIGRIFTSPMIVESKTTMRVE